MRRCLGVHSANTSDGGETTDDGYWWSHSASHSLTEDLVSVCNPIQHPVLVCEAAVGRSQPGWRSSAGRGVVEAAADGAGRRLALGGSIGPADRRLVVSSMRRS